MIDTYTSLHIHSTYSSGLLQFADSTIYIDKALNLCYEMGLRGMSLTDHEGVSGFVELEQDALKMNKDRPFQHIFGNEIYLLSEEENKLRYSEDKRPTYWHFLLNVLDEEGLHQLYELSSRAWLRSYMFKGLRRKPTFYSDIEEVIGKNPGHIVGSTGCLGGQLPKFILNNDLDKAQKFIKWGKQVFGTDNFFLECQPYSGLEANQDQYTVNKALWSLHEETKTPIIVTTDAHYLRPEDRIFHKRFLKSKDGGDTREVDSFYQETYLFSPQELREKLYLSDFNDEQVDALFATTNQIADRVQPITLKKTTQVPMLPSIPEFKIQHKYKQYYSKFPNISYYANSQDEYEQYYFAQVEKGLIQHEATHDLDIEKYLKQIDIEMEQIKGLGEIFDHQRMCDYFTVVQKVIDLIWSDGDSLIGIGRGSSGAYVTNKLLGITGIDPLEEGLEGFYPWWRFCSIARSDSIFDIDIDIQSFKKEQIIKAIKDYFGERQVCQCVTWGRLTSRTAIERACKALDVPEDASGYIRSLIPVKRGNIYSIKDCLYGNESKKRERVPEFANEIKKYPELLETALAFEGLIISSGVHAGALNILKKDFTDTGSLMVSSNGSVVNQYDLHMGEYCGQLKFDLLSIDCLESIRACMDLLLKRGLMKWQGNLRDTYNYYLSYDVIEKDSQEMWDLLPKMANAFQYDTRAGKDALRKVGARNINELTMANGLMRLQVAETEQPIDKFVRYKNDINEWYQDMTDYGLTKEEQEIYKELLGPYNGLCIAQETMMIVLMDKRVCNFTLKESDKARKAVAKKNEEALKETEERLYRKGAECGRSKKFLDYLWNVQIEMSKSYAFAFSHSHEYSTECLQELNLYYKFPKIYWNTAVVTTQSQTLDERENSNSSTDYGKIAKSIYKARESNVFVQPPSINNSEISFTPIEENNTILFGLGGISGINQAIAQEIVDGRPYASFKQFYNHFKSKQGTKVTRSKFITLVKAGCFDDFSKDKINLMRQLCYYEYDMKTKLTTANISQAIKLKVNFPKELLAAYSFKSYVLSKQNFYCNDPKFKSKKHYIVDEKAMEYFFEHCMPVMVEDKDYYYENDRLIVVDKSLEKILKSQLTELNSILNSPDFIKDYNKKMLNQQYREMTKNNSPEHWAMETISFYPDGTHELDSIDFDEYNISHYGDLPEEPEFVERTARGRTWKQYNLSRICGVVLARNDNNHLVDILTPDNEVVNIKFNGGQYAYYKQTISDQDTGRKMDTNWFTKGNLIAVSGYRRGEDGFVAKKYKNTVYRHAVMLITKVNEDNTLEFQFEKYGVEE